MSAVCVMNLFSVGNLTVVILLSNSMVVKHQCRFAVFCPTTSYTSA